jgi:hypothetical protein
LRVGALDVSLHPAGHAQAPIQEIGARGIRTEPARAEVFMCSAGTVVLGQTGVRRSLRGRAARHVWPERKNTLGGRRGKIQVALSLDHDQRRWDGSWTPVRRAASQERKRNATERHGPKSLSRAPGALWRGKPRPSGSAPHDPIETPPSGPLHPRDCPAGCVPRSASEGMPRGDRCGSRGGLNNTRSAGQRDMPPSSPPFVV